MDEERGRDDIAFVASLHRAARLSSGFHTGTSGCSRGQIQHTLLTMTSARPALH